MIKVVYLCSRDWSKDILSMILKNDAHSLAIASVVIHKRIDIDDMSDTMRGVDVCVVSKYSELNLISESLAKLKPDLILAFGWSGYLDENIRKIAPVLVLHPSKLPKFRGGSPIQNQLINGVNDSAVSILKAADVVDGGEIYFQATLSLRGNLRDIKKRIALLGYVGTLYIASQSTLGGLKNFPSMIQDESESTSYKRRTQSDGEIFPSDFLEKEANYFYDLVRGLDEDYPRAFIRCSNNTILNINSVSVGENDAVI